MKSIIKELWRGNVMPPEDGRQNTPEMQQLLEYISRHNDDLLKTITDEQKEIFEKFHDCWSEYASLSDEALFEYAFKLGMQIAIEVLSSEKSYLNARTSLVFQDRAKYHKIFTYIYHDIVHNYLTISPGRSIIIVSNYK